MLSSHVILAVLSADQEGIPPDESVTNIFVEMGILPSIKQKVLESISGDAPSISRPAREARDLILALEKRIA